ncbi:MAG TPA: hypothetical protein VGH28_18820 [Polyangiaceae bacterium]|jgi:hypothetical protein
MSSSGAWQKRTRSAEEIAGASRDAMTRAMRADAELAIAFAREDAVLLGAFQRACDGPPGAIVRGTPGGAVRIGPGTLHVMLALTRLDCDETKILNRHVRPLLRAIGGRYFGRDWVDLGGHPVAHVGFAHSRATGRTVVEAFVSMRTPLDGARATYLGKSPTTLDPADDEKLVAKIIAAYGVPLFEPAPVAPSPADETPWVASIDEAIGPIRAGRDASGCMRVGGEFMASFDAIADLEDRLSRAEDVRPAVDAAFTAPHTALFGVRSLESFARAIEAAL